MLTSKFSFANQWTKVDIFPSDCPASYKYSLLTIVKLEVLSTFLKGIQINTHFMFSFLINRST